MSIGTEIAEVVKAAEMPITKLVEAICGAIGKVYEPFHHKRMTNAMFSSRFRIPAFLSRKRV